MSISPDALRAQLETIIKNRIEQDRLVIPAFPAAATKALNLLKDPGVNFKRVTSLLETDPVFAALVLRAASAAAYGGNAVTSLDAAANRLGVTGLRQVLMQAAARTAFESHDRSITQRLALVWKHSVAVALLARDVGSLISLPDVEVCYLAGLLHDVGKPIVASLLLEVERSLRKTSWLTADQWCEVIDACHRPLGVAVAQKWNMAPAVIDAVRENLEYNAGDRKSPANVVRFANAMVKQQGIAPGKIDVEDAGALVMIGRSMLGLDEAVLGRLSSGLHERLDGAFAA